VIGIGLIAAPGLPTDLVEALAEDLRAELQHRSPSISWCIIHVVDLLVQPPADDVGIVRAARPRIKPAPMSSLRDWTPLREALDRWSTDGGRNEHITAR
jgi:hypothetical protein